MFTVKFSILLDVSETLCGKRDKEKAEKKEAESLNFRAYFATFLRAGSGHTDGQCQDLASGSTLNQERWVLQLTWHAGAPGHPGGSWGSTASGEHRCRAGKPTPSWGRWQAPGGASSPLSGNNIASPTGASCQHQ